MNNFNQNVIRHKIGLLNLATELGNVSKACHVLGLCPAIRYTVTRTQWPKAG